MQLTAAAMLALTLAVCPSAAGQQLPQLPPNPLPVPQLPPQTFVDWLAAFRSEAAERGITAATLDRALSGLEPLPVVVERDRSQAELVLTLDQYLERRLTRSMIKAAQKMGVRHRTLLRKVSAKYGVPPGVIIAIWGLESNYGRFSGVRPTIATLATLAYDPRRSAMFREELLNALKILDSGDVEPAAMRGSWAGALGQPQFMPSSFLEFAQDFDGDGRRDIWTSTPDVFASIANYLSAHGWVKGQSWGREVKVPASIADAIAEAAPLQTTGCLAERQMSVPLPLSQWRTRGVRTMAGTKVPAGSVQASLVAAGPRRFLMYPNYQALLAYNCVHAYGLSVALLSDRVH
jgi:peptidoglycan lytic transglycosylase B